MTTYSMFNLEDMPVGGSKSILDVTDCEGTKQTVTVRENDMLVLISCLRWRMACHQTASYHYKNGKYKPEPVWVGRHELERYRRKMRNK